MVAAPKQKGMFGLAGFGPFAGAGGSVDEKPMSGLADLLAEYQKPRGNWADAAGVLGGALMDLDGTMGSGNMTEASDRFKEFRREDQAQFQAEQQKKIVQAAAAGDEFALALMDPLGNRTFKTGRADRKEDLSREDAAINREEGWKLKDFLHTVTRDETSDDQWEKAFEENQRQFGISSELDQQGIDQRNLAALLSAEGKSATGEGQLRREYLSQNQDFLDMQRSIQKIRGLDTTTAPGQMGLIFNLMKLYDPGSTVREGEFANAENARGVPGTVVNMYNKIVGGEFLTDEQISQFRETADGLYDSSLQDFERSYKTYKNDIAPGYGYDTDRTIPDLRDQTMQLDRALSAINRTTASGQVVSPDGVKLLLQDLSPETMDEFDADFGRGSAAQILQQLGIPQPERVRPRTYDIPR